MANEESAIAGKSGAPVRPPVSWSRILHYAVLVLILLGGGAYWLLKPPTINPMSDPMAAQAMALVQTHRARHAPTLRQAIDHRVQSLTERGQGVRLQEWRVERQGDELYLVRVAVREQGTKEWFERNYVWQADVGKRTVTAHSVAASDLMPLQAGGAALIPQGSPPGPGFPRRAPDNRSL